ncbi:MAG: hypothetical protein ACPKNR_13945 [Pleomorphochaeta sp.]
MKKINTIISFVSIFFAILILIQYTIYCFGNINLEQIAFNNSLLLSFSMLIAGIINLINKKNSNKYIVLISAILYLFGGLIYIFSNQIYDNLLYVAIVCFIFALFQIINYISTKKQLKNNKYRIK